MRPGTAGRSPHKVPEVIRARDLCPEAFRALDAEVNLSEEQFSRLEDAMTTAVFSGRAMAPAGTSAPVMESDMERQNRELGEARWKAVQSQHEAERSARAAAVAAHVAQQKARREADGDMWTNLRAPVNRGTDRTPEQIQRMLDTLDRLSEAE